MHRTIKYLNEMLCCASITITENATNDRQGQLVRITTPNGKIIVNLARNKLYRVFNNGSFNFGGRFYGPFWQNLPKSIRAMLLIDGEAVNEGDYRQLHPRLLYAQAGVTLEDEDDAYTIDGIDRQLAKRGFNIAINAETKLAAIRALAQEISGKNDYAKASAYAEAGELLDALVTKHARIARCFSSGAGLRLQRHDAELAERVMLELVKRGITVLPVHDSFIVQHRHAATRDQIMDAELDRMLATLSGAKSPLYQLLILKRDHIVEILLRFLLLPFFLTGSSLVGWCRCWCRWLLSPLCPVAHSSCPCALLCAMTLGPCA